MKRTFLDSGVLIEAMRGTSDVSIKAREIISDNNREFASSIFIKLEVLPKAIYYKNTVEVAFYEDFFDLVVHWANPHESLIQDAYKLACNTGIAALDALHVAAAISIGAEELITTEKPHKPMHRASGIKIISIVPD